MGCKFEKFQLVLKTNQENKDIELHLVDGGTIKLTFLNTEIFDMANGSTFVLGRAVDQEAGFIDELCVYSSEEEHWKKQ
ncbi:hypothetical protein [Shimazuella alba]|jgi:hypothetical protein|uniref:Uncharacterized protein n=1 Tax=Shimazuella alba TaxID=2690964 RepID=A0A6I4VVA7_9BACL|nr:hypothetical protein [Shimazuella alba]MXQ54933.1 hypothetical protein [Shimazuella alba]